MGVYVLTRIHINKTHTEVRQSGYYLHSVMLQKHGQAASMLKVGDRILTRELIFLKVKNTMHNFSLNTKTLLVRLNQLWGSWGIIPFKWNAQSNMLTQNCKTSTVTQARKCKLLYFVTAFHILPVLAWHKFTDSRSKSIMDKILAGFSVLVLITMSAHTYGLVGKSLKSFNGQMEFSSSSKSVINTRVPSIRVEHR